MPKAKLDTLFCLTATCPSGKNKVDYWDTIISDFVLECRASGGKTYALRYVDENGTQRQHKIGGCRDITFDQARKKARTVKSQVTLGGDPAAEKAEKKAIPTYDQLADQHLAFAKTYQKAHSSTEMILRRHLRPKWGKLRINQIETQEIAKWLAEKRESGLAPATVEKIRVTLNRSFEVAAKWNLPGAQHNPVRARRSNDLQGTPLNRAGQGTRSHGTDRLISRPELHRVQTIPHLTDSKPAAWYYGASTSARNRG